MQCLQDRHVLQSKLSKGTLETAQTPVLGNTDQQGRLESERGKQDQSSLSAMA
jgi:hypothetical protein